MDNKDRIYCLWEGKPAVLVQQSHPRHLTYNLYLIKNDSWLASGWMSVKDLNDHIEDRRCIIDKNIEVLYE